MEAMAARAEADAAGGSACHWAWLGRQRFQAYRAGAEREVGRAQEVLELVTQHKQLRRAVASQLERQVPELPPDARRAPLPEAAQGGL